MSYSSIVSVACVGFLWGLLFHDLPMEVAACTANKCVSVEVYYESLCPDSIRFITTQLTPSYSSFKEHLNIHFIPYGKATHEINSEGKWTFTCQHGPPECEGNKGQACVLEAIEKFEAPNKGQDIKVQFVDCAMRRGYKQCISNDLNPEAPQYIENCTNSLQGDMLLVKYGDKTDRLQPPVSFIPTIVINEVYSEKNQLEARTNFRGLICKYLTNEKDKPVICT